MRAYVTIGVVALAWTACANLRAEEAPVAKTEAKSGEADKPKDEALVDQPEDLAKAIAEATKMLEDKKYKEFLERFVHPDDKKRITKTWDKVVEGFGEKSGRLLEILKLIGKSKVKLTDEGKTASFTVNPALEGNKPTIRFGKIEKDWYLFNH